MYPIMKTSSDETLTLDIDQISWEKRVRMLYWEEEIGFFKLGIRLRKWERENLGI